MSQPPQPHAAESGSSPGGGFEGVTEILGIRPLESAPDPLVGRTIGDVTLVAVLAEGGMGRVYEGRQRSPDRAVAVKVLRPGFITAEGVKRFAREAQVLGTLSHPNIAQVYWAGACDVVGAAVPFIVMEFVPGAVAITDYARDHGLDTTARLELFRKVCAAVAHGHAAGVVHRDLKPGNVLVDSAGEPKLIDFGIARLADPSGESTALTELGRLVGTVQYMSPEQIAGDAAAIDPRTDVYALGLLLHELLAGRRPYEIDPRRLFDAAAAVRGRKPVSLAGAAGGLPAPGLERVVERCLAFDPAGRYADAAAVATALDAAAVGAGPEPRRRRRLLAAAAGVALAAAGVCWLPRGAAPRTAGRPADAGLPAASPAPAATRDPPGRPAGRRVLSAAEATAARPLDGILTFDGVAEIPLDVAELLVVRGQRLRIFGPVAVGPDLADILGRNRRGVELPGVRTVTVDVVERLVRTRGPLGLDGVESLDVATARVLAGHGDWLNVAGLTDLSDEVLAELVKHRGHGMALRVPGPLDRGRAEIVARHRGDLYLLGVESVDEDAARALAAHHGSLHVDAARVTPEADRILGGIE